jgi:aspartate kinase
MLARAAAALNEKKIEILAVNQCMRQINLQFIVTRDAYKPAVTQLHKRLINS